MSTSRTFGMEGVNGAACHGVDGAFHKATFVQRGCVDHDLNIHLISHLQTAIDGSGRGAPILMQLQSCRSRQYHFLQSLRL